MTNQMVPRFRVKKISYKNPLQIYKASEQPDILKDAVDVPQTAANIETGVEKEEEDEYDLQAVLSEAKNAVKTGQEVQSYIPIPDASSVISEKQFQHMYRKRFKEPTNLIRFSMTVEDSLTGAQYYMDEQDVEFVDKYNKDHPSVMITEDTFEDIMYQIESVVNTQLPHLSLDSTNTPQPNTLLDMLPESYRTSRYNMMVLLTYWRSRRLKRDGKPIIPQLRYEDTLKNEIDPYVCFRRRETKPVRKTRRTDQQSLERLRKLRNEMEKARNLFEMVLRREKLRKETLVQEHHVFEKRCDIRAFQKILDIKDEDALLPISKKKRKISTDTGSSTTIKIPRSLLRQNGGDALDRHEKSPMQLALESELAKKREEDAPYDDITECPYQPFPMDLPMQFFQVLPTPSPNTPQPHTRQFRKRIGRGGRVFIDRIGHRTPSLSPDRYMFDDDHTEMDEVIEIDETDDKFLRHRAQLLSTEELRSFVLDIPSKQQGSSPMTSSGPGPSGSLSIATSSLSSSSSSVSAAVSPQTPRSNNNNNKQVSSQENLNSNNAGAAPNGNVASSIVKRQNSRQRKTPQQASEEMAKGLLAANITAVVNKANQLQQTPLQ
ncbi:enhancer of polycomb-like-domain-containing protein, partial [Phascolomyces articulosus]